MFEYRKAFNLKEEPHMISDLYENEGTASQSPGEAVIMESQKAKKKMSKPGIYSRKQGRLDRSVQRFVDFLCSANSFCQKLRELRNEIGEKLQEALLFSGFKSWN